MFLPYALSRLRYGLYNPREAINLDMKAKAQPKSHGKIRRQNPVFDVQVIPAPTIIWHPSVSLEKLLSDFSEYQDSIIVS
jgi:hypothetical protein